VTSSFGTLVDLADADRSRLESLLFQFDRAWSHDGLAACVKQLPPADRVFRQAALVELVKIDLEWQWRAGNRHTVEDYLKRFPELAGQQTVSAELLVAEYEARQQFGTAADREDFKRRFPAVALSSARLPEPETDARLDGEPVEADINTSGKGPGGETAVQSRGRPAALPQRFGRYRILGALGVGGMGTVFLAHDEKLDRKVALKVPKPECLDSPELLQRFYQEARAAAALVHRNICPIFDIGDVDGVHYISMAWIEGQSLQAWTAGKQGLSARHAASIVHKLALALQKAHSRGVVHRDLKPANIMMDREQEPVVTDFGLARQLDKDEHVRLTHHGAILGTPAYMSPEQIAGETERVQAASDIYSLGVIFFELLSGQLPFAGTVASVTARKLTEDAPRVAAIRPDVDPVLDAVCAKMLSRRIEDRYQTMQQVADALRGSLAGDVSSDAATLVDPMPVITADERTGDGGGLPPQAASLPPPRSAPHRALLRLAITAGFVAPLIALAGVIIWYRGSKYEVPDGATVEITEQGLRISPPTVEEGRAQHGPELPRGRVPFSAQQAADLQQQVANQLNVPVVYRNTLGMELVLIPPGTFQMGATSEEIQLVWDKDSQKGSDVMWVKSEQPRHTVNLTRPYYLGRCEVTLEQFRQYAQVEPLASSPDDDVSAEDEDAGDVQQPASVTWSAPGFPQGPDHPVTAVTWFEASGFCRWLSRKEGRSYRLPWEAEWEYACRAGTDTIWSVGDDVQEVAHVANVADQAFAAKHPVLVPLNWNDGFVYTAPVASFHANAFGLYDMHGNVAEWCGDLFGDNYYQQCGREVDDPTGPATARGRRSYRGGYFTHSPYACRSACRRRNPPQKRYWGRGFRVLCEIPAEEAARRSFRAEIHTEAALQPGDQTEYRMVAVRPQVTFSWP